MSQIAAEAKLSVGQIYRYFSNKDAIIEEMIRRIIDHRIAEMEGKTQTHLMPHMLAWRETLSEDDDALLDMLQANLFGAYRLTRRVLPAMMARHWADGCKPKWCVGPKSAKPLASGLRSSVDRRNYDYISEQAEQLMLST